MRALVTWCSKRGGTEGIGRIVAEALQASGFEVVAAPLDQVTDIASFDAAIVGGALYANRWPRKLRSFVNRHIWQLRRVPVWFFSSGPLDESAERENIPPPPQVAVLAERVGAKGHVTFGGRLEPGATGFPAGAMAKTHSGDWRDPARIRAWAAELAAEIPGSTPGRAAEPPGRSIPRLIEHAFVGWAVCAGIVDGGAIHSILTALVFALLAWHYFRARGAREPLTTAVVWTATFALLDLTVIAGAIQHSLAMFTKLAATWAPFGLVLVATWITGEVISMMPDGRSGNSPPTTQLASKT